MLSLSHDPCLSSASSESAGSDAVDVDTVAVEHDRDLLPNYNDAYERERVGGDCAGEGAHVDGEDEHVNWDGSTQGVPEREVEWALRGQFVF